MQLKKKKKSLEFRDNIWKILKKIDKIKADYATATMLAVIEGFILGYENGASKK